MRYVDANKSPLANTGDIKIYNEYGFTCMHEVGRHTAEALDLVGDIIQPGMTTQDIDDFIVDYANKHNLICAPLNYKGFPKSVCTSVNHVICHGIPSSSKILQEGNIVNIDVTFVKNGWYGDSSRMYTVGKILRQAQRLIDITHEALWIGIEQVKPGNWTGDIGEAIQRFVEAKGLSVVTDFCGHGIGRLFHDCPNILHFGKKKTGYELREGMLFTIEPMINIGKPAVRMLADGWTAVTRDKSLSAQYEHTIGVTKDGYEVFTLSRLKSK